MNARSNCFTQLVMGSARRLAMPIAVYPGLALTGATVKDIVNSSKAQFETQTALHQRYHTPVVMSAMDLSAEAEAFGCTLHLADNEVPSVTGRLVTTLEEAEKLTIPKPGDGRTGVYLDTVRLLKTLPGRPLVFGGCIGPFSLAARLVGVSEAMELTVTEPDQMRLVIEKSAAFLAEYARAFKEAGADGLIMAEPAAGLLSPRSLSTNSSSHIKIIGDSLADGHFALILHNCAAKLLHLPAILETGLSAFHFGAPMDLPAALGKAPSDVILCGNLDPAGVFCQASPDEVTQRAKGLLASTESFRNYVLSSGCDIPPGASLANLDAFYAAV